LGCRVLDFKMQDTGLYDAGYWTLECNILDFRIEDTGL
jgi:hypothetical protein